MLNKEFQMLKQVVVFGHKVSENVIGRMIEENLPVEVIKVMSSKDDDYLGNTESEIREQTELMLRPFIGKVNVIILCEPEIAFSAQTFLSKKYPYQKFVGYGQNLPNLLKNKQTARVLLSKSVKKMTRYQEIKSEFTNMEISEREFSLKERQHVRSRDLIDYATRDFSGGLIIIYTPDLIRMKSLIEKKFTWRADVVDMRPSLLRETCLALNLRGIDGKLTRDIKG